MWSICVGEMLCRWAWRRMPSVVPLPAPCSANICVVFTPLRLTGPRCRDSSLTAVMLLQAHKSVIAAHACHLFFNLPLNSHSCCCYCWRHNSTHILCKNKHEANFTIVWTKEENKTKDVAKLLTISQNGLKMLKHIVTIWLEVVEYII